VKEADIYAQPHRALRGWRAFYLGDSVLFTGFDSDSNEICTESIQFFDSSRQCVMSEDGIVWHIPLSSVYCQDFEDCTPQIVFLMEARQADAQGGQATAEETAASER